ncbi:MAG: 2'-5' RNA ligase family protein [Eubacterium sp.]|nr:2'-5' RNA ligase family protein [Eubacterium sp.]
MKQYAVVVIFDNDAQRKINELINYAAQVTGNGYMLAQNIPPHITIASFYDEDESRIADAIDENITLFKRGDVSFSELGSFPPAVIFLAPKLSEYLIELNLTVNSIVPEDIRRADFYVPGRWFPHCSLAVRLEGVEKPLEQLTERFAPLTAEVCRIDFAECEPYRVVGSWEIKN